MKQASHCFFMLYYLIYLLNINTTTTEKKIDDSNAYIKERLDIYHKWNTNGCDYPFQNQISDATYRMIKKAEGKKGLCTVESVILRPIERIFEDLDNIADGFKALTNNDEFITVRGLSDIKEAVRLLRTPFKDRHLKQVKIQALDLLYRSEKTLIENCIRDSAEKSTIIQRLENIKKKIQFTTENSSANNKHIQIRSILSDFQNKLCDIDSIVTIHVLINNSVEGIESSDFVRNLLELKKFRQKLLSTAYDIALTIEIINMIDNIENLKQKIEEVYQAFIRILNLSTFDRESIQCAESLEKQHKDISTNLNLIYRKFDTDLSEKLSFYQPKNFFMNFMAPGFSINSPTRDSCASHPISQGPGSSSNPPDKWSIPPGASVPNTFSSLPPSE